MAHARLLCLLLGTAAVVVLAASKPLLFGLGDASPKDVAAQEWNLNATQPRSADGSSIAEVPQAVSDLLQSLTVADGTTLPTLRLEASLHFSHVVAGAMALSDLRTLRTRFDFSASNDASGTLSLAVVEKHDATQKDASASEEEESAEEGLRTVGTLEVPFSFSASAGGFASTGSVFLKGKGADKKTRIGSYVALLQSRTSAVVSLYFHESADSSKKSNTPFVLKASGDWKPPEGVWWHRWFMPGLIFISMFGFRTLQAFTEEKNTQKEVAKAKK